MTDGATARASAPSAQGPRASDATPPEPVLPDWGGASLDLVVPTLLGELSAPGRSPLPGWFPEAVAGAGQIVLLVLDGLGEEQLRERASLAPTLMSGVGGPITSVAPSTTACALTTLVTGKVPALHGVLGYRLALDPSQVDSSAVRLRAAESEQRLRAGDFFGAVECA